MKAPKNPVRKLLLQIESLRSEMAKLEGECLPHGLDPCHLDGARNLLHYVALRRHDIRELQQDLAALGLSSLGRTESHVLGTMEAVRCLLRRLDGGQHGPEECDPDLTSGRKLLDQNTNALLGEAPSDRRVRIMVTMPSEAATDYEMVRALVAEGMNCMRINCAHDDAEAWAAMIANLRRAEKELGKTCKVEMDLAGPKLRTGPIAPGPAVVKYRPQRDVFGRVIAPTRVWFTALDDCRPAPSGADVSIPVTQKWLSQLRRGSRIRFIDTRGAKRSILVRQTTDEGCWAEATRTAYIRPGLVLSVACANGKTARARIGQLPPRPRSLFLSPGDKLLLTKSDIKGRPASEGRPAQIGVTLPEFFESVKPGQPIWFDDGNIGGVIESVGPETVTAKIAQGRAEQKLGAEKGINIPETDLRISSLTPEDRTNLEFVARNADIIGFSFVRTATDVRELRRALAKLNCDHVGILLKIETRAGFENLPRLLMEAMRSRAVGVMIARGDLAVECGYQRLAELQEEILWIAEAAHVPVVWATQVLESLAKTGKPSRSEITDAAMGERAECVMLNKGPFVVEAVQTLHDILVRMQAHQEKKTSMLRKLSIATAYGARNGAES